MYSTKKPIRYTAAMALCASVIGCVCCTTCKRADSVPSASGSDRAKEPRTRAQVQEITPQEAKRLIDNETQYVYLDVRTVEEFTEGHVPGAWNVPIILFDQDGGGRGRNERFLPVVKATIPKDRRVIVGCRSGHRSAMAVKLMKQAGYSDVWNMVGGFIGKRDASGEWVQPGWSQLGYPTEQGDAGEVGYASLAGCIPD